MCYIESLGSDGSKIDSCSQSFWFTHTHTHTHTVSLSHTRTHTHTHTQYGPQWLTLTAFLHLPSRASRQIFYLPGPMLHLPKLEHTPHKFTRKTSINWTRFVFNAPNEQRPIILNRNSIVWPSCSLAILPPSLQCQHVIVVLSNWALDADVNQLGEGVRVQVPPPTWLHPLHRRILFGLPLMGDSGIPKISK